MDITMSDIILHIDEDINKDEREELRDNLFSINGVITADSQDKTPHLMIVGYSSVRVHSSVLLSAVTSQGLHAQLVGL